MPITSDGVPGLADHQFSIAADRNTNRFEHSAAIGPGNGQYAVPFLKRPTHDQCRRYSRCTRPSIHLCLAVGRTNPGRQPIILAAIRPQHTDHHGANAPTTLDNTIANNRAETNKMDARDYSAKRLTPQLALHVQAAIATHCATVPFVGPSVH